jgi:hypothetical protein
MFEFFRLGRNAQDIDIEIVNEKCGTRSKYFNIELT